MTLTALTEQLENSRTRAETLPSPQQVPALIAPPLRFVNTKSFHDAAEMVQCKQCARMVKDISRQLLEQHLDSLKPDTQVRLTAKHGAATTGTKPAFQNTRAASKILSLTSAGYGVSGGARLHAAARACEARGEDAFLWEGAKIHSNTTSALQNNEAKSNIFPCLCLYLLHAPPYSRYRHSK